MPAWYILLISAGNWNAKHVTALLPRSSNMILGSEKVQLSSATTNQHLDMQGWAMPVDRILKYNGLCIFLINRAFWINQCLINNICSNLFILSIHYRNETKQSQ
jgi:hypothetical protein